MKNKDLFYFLDKDLIEHIEMTPKGQDGDITINCYKLVKEFKKDPLKIAEELESQIPNSKSTKGFLNIKLNKNQLSFILSSFSKDFFKVESKANQEHLIEYFQPNTHKDFHVGHLRNLALGKSIENLYKYLQIPLKTATYPGDLGTHVAKVISYLKQLSLEEKKKLFQSNKGKELGKIYAKACQLEHKDLTTILTNIREKKGSDYFLWKYTRQWSLNYMNEILQWANVKFDIWNYESELDESSVNWVNELYSQKLLEKDDGAIGIDLDKLGFFILLKKDGNGLYSTKDLLLAKERSHFEKCIYLVDERQSNHFKQVFKTLDKLNIKHDCTHLPYSHVELKTGAMKSRDGNAVPLTELITKMEEVLEEKFNNSKENSKIIAKAACFYGILKTDPNKKVIFDMDEWLKMDGNSGPYLLYTTVRGKSILNKSNIKETPLNLSHENETKLILKLSQFNEVLDNSFDKMKVSFVANYLYELSKEFNSFYKNCPILNQKEDVKQTRLKIVQATVSVLEKGLGILNVEVPDKM